MQLNSERCPACGKYKSLMWTNANVNAAVPAYSGYVPTFPNTTLTSGVYPGTFHLDTGAHLNGAGAAPALFTPTYDMCSCVGY